ncbi:regulator of chromosome condensation-like [Sycon ciliatum]|uniref:regulator of chromosome condensation-like n=1 Tax=Sycon ciliatum TaxID=27933 RepID=UPI0020A84967|eukprot:scpid63774/ scgid23957/ Regulator of chromosome condensation
MSKRKHSLSSQSGPSAKKPRVSLQRFTSRTEGTLLTLGQGDMGQLGLGEDIMERRRPAIVRELEDIPIKQVVCGGMHTVALTTEGKVYTFGCNDEGALGRTGDEALPGLVDLKGDVVQISAGDSHTGLLMADGSLLACGTFRDGNGIIGLTADTKKATVPTVIFPADCVRVSSGSDHMAVVKADGTLWTFGNAEQGQLGRVPTCFSMRGGRRGLKFLLEPHRVEMPRHRTVTDVYCGSFHTFAVVEHGTEVYVFGLNNYGQLGLGDVEMRNMPCRLENFPPADVSAKEHEPQFSGGQHHSLMLYGGRVYAFGRSDYGRLGLGGSDVEVTEMTQVPGLSNVSHLTTGSAVSLCCDADGKSLSWGMGTNNQLASEGEDDVDCPTAMIGKQIESRRVLAISGGGQHTALIVE